MATAVFQGSIIAAAPRHGGVLPSQSRVCRGAVSVARPLAKSSLRVASLRSSLYSEGVGSSFFNGGASKLALVATQVSCSRSLGGGALGAEMNIFQRVVRIVQSYANAAVSSAEDPEKLLDQTVLEMNDDLVKMRQASAQVLASQKQLENKYKQAQQVADDWYRRAKLALEKGDETLAKEALKRRKDYEDSAKALKMQLDQQKGVVEKLITNTRMLEGKIQEAKAKKDTLKARAQSAKTATKVNEMLGNLNTSSALAAFEKMEEKVMSLEAESDALNQLSTDDLANKASFCALFAQLEGDSVDDDLAQLKSDLLGTSKKSGELPPGRSTASSSSQSSGISVKDLEIEAELNELRRKAKDY
eukprot:jgi/Mesen1/5038/ME000025S04441